MAAGSIYTKMLHTKYWQNTACSSCIVYIDGHNMSSVLSCRDFGVIVSQT